MQLVELPQIKKIKTRLVLSRLITSEVDIKLEIGSGPVKGQNGWITLDLSMNADLYWDLCKSLPFPDKSVAMIYSSHVLEHFSYPDLVRLLKECLRILKPGGSFSACVPDARLYVQGYINPDAFDQKLLSYKPGVISTQGIDIINYIAYMDGHHKYMFDRGNLVRVLSLVGFAKVHLRDFDPKIDLPERQHESIYVMCIKPEASLNSHM